MSANCHACREVPGFPEHVGEVPLNSAAYFFAVEGRPEITSISGWQARQLVRALPSRIRPQTTTTFGVQATTVFANSDATEPLGT